MTRGVLSIFLYYLFAIKYSIIILYKYSELEIYMFKKRHIEHDSDAIKDMLDTLEVASIDALIDSAFPENIREGNQSIMLPPTLSEEEAMEEILAIAQKNIVKKSLIGNGYYGAIMPSVIKRNVFENPGWYTAYTAYQSEISQGRLEALFNFQTLITELTGLPIANASLLDEGTAIAEAITLAHRYHKGKRNKVLLIEGGHPQNNSVIMTRMEALSIEVVLCTHNAIDSYDMEHVFCVVMQLPTTRGFVYDVAPIIKAAHNGGAICAASIDPLFLTIAGSPVEWGMDIVVGSLQRFGIPLGYGGPSAAFMATTDALKRMIPGRIVGESVDTQGRKAFRFSLQTREQHIRREKATSNICTSQVFLAVLSSFYAVYHGEKGLRDIALQVFSYAHRFRKQLQTAGFKIFSEYAYFDTVCWNAGNKSSEIFSSLSDAGYNIRRLGAQFLSISFDETVSEQDFQTISSIMDMPIEETGAMTAEKPAEQMTTETIYSEFKNNMLPYMVREKAMLTQAVFHRYHTETEMMRYCRKLMDKDLALDRSMIPLGSCTMKLNPASTMIPLGWSEFANIHPFAPLEQALGYKEIIESLEEYLCIITGYDKMSLQPNAGSQGEFAGLLAIKAYHKHRGETQRDICLIPASAHGTNPASAQMAGLKVVVVQCDKDGTIDMQDYKEKLTAHSEELAALMITYPSTHGVYEDNVKEVCELTHLHGGQVYIDGANLNALVGVSKIAMLGGDVSHLNLHKTFAIPHGGGGPGVGPIGIKSHLAPFLPKNIIVTALDSVDAKHGEVGQISSSPWGSSLVFIITWMYIRMLGEEGIQASTKRAILHANYITKRLEGYYDILYKGNNDRIAHECILDMRKFKEIGISVEDIAKRLIDYGFHAPTMSFPVAGTLMVEPTESESKYELDRFCDAMILIRKEIDKVESGAWSKEDNPLVNAPHCAQDICSDAWEHPYSRNEAAYPYVKDALNPVHKYWSPISRIDNVYGDKNLVCSCPPMEEYLTSGIGEQ